MKIQRSKAMTKLEKRKAVLNDMLKQIEAGVLIAERMAYIRVPSMSWGFRWGKEYIPEIPKCKVCQLGGMAISIVTGKHLLLFA